MTSSCLISRDRMRSCTQSCGGIQCILTFIQMLQYHYAHQSPTIGPLIRNHTLAIAIGNWLLKSKITYCRNIGFWVLFSSDNLLKGILKMAILHKFSIIISSYTSTFQFLTTNITSRERPFPGAFLPSPLATKKIPTLTTSSRPPPPLDFFSLAVHSRLPTLQFQ